MNGTELKERDETREVFGKDFSTLMDAAFAETLLASHVLADIRFHEQRHQSTGVNPNADSVLAGYKHGWNEDLVGRGIITEERLLALAPGERRIGCDYVAKVLPSILTRLERQGMIKRNDNGTYSTTTRD